MIREKSVPEISGSGDDQAIVGDLPEYSGNSAAFTSSPCEGVTVSAEEGAFMEDTVVSYYPTGSAKPEYEVTVGDASCLQAWLFSFDIVGPIQNAFHTLTEEDLALADQRYEALLQE